jgi:hypothetical protein
MGTARRPRRFRSPPDHEPPEPDYGELSLRELSERERWPEPGGLRGLVRALLGRPASTGSDEVTMRADSERVARLLVAEHQRSPVGEPRPHPGLENLARRSERRAVAAVRASVKRLTSSHARVTAAQAELDRAGGEQGAAADELATLPELPDPPLLGRTLTRPRAVWPLMILVLIPIEAMLTYQQLQVLGMSDNKTFAFAALIGISVALVAEVLGLLLHYTFVQENADEGGGRSPFYWLVTGYAAVLVLAGGFTLWQLSDARENNQKIVEQRNARIEQAREALGGDGFAGVSGSSGIGSTVDDVADKLDIDLEWTFALQGLVLLAAAGVSLRKRMAEEYNDVATDRARRVRRARFAENRLRRAEQRMARLNGPYAATMREIRLGVESERAFLLELFERVRSLVYHEEPELTVVLPDLPDIEQTIVRLLEPELPRLGQPTVRTLPAAQPPDVYAAPRRAAAAAAPEPVPGGWGAAPLQPGPNLIPGVGWVFVPRPGEPLPWEGVRRPAPAGAGEPPAQPRPAAADPPRRAPKQPPAASTNGTARVSELDGDAGTPPPTELDIPASNGRRFERRLAEPGSADESYPYRDALARIDAALDGGLRR